MAPAHVGQRELRDEQLFPFEAAVRRSGIASVMPAYCDVDGVPCHASTELLDAILRDEWGFDGIVASDYMGIEMLATAHRLTGDLGDGGAPGARSRASTRSSRGPPPSASPLAAGLAERPRRRSGPRRRRRPGAPGQVPARALRAAVRRPVPDRGRPRRARRGRGAGPPVGSPSARSSWSRTTGSCRSRPTSGAVAVIGPIADSARDLLGDYSHLVHMRDPRARCATGGDRARDRRRRRGDRAGRRAGRPADDPRRDPRPRSSAPRSSTPVAPGSRDGTDEEIEAAVDGRARVGRRDPRRRRAVRPDRRLDDRASSATGATLGFLGRQQELLEAVVATGHAGRARRRQRPAARLDWAAGHVRTRSSSRGCPATPARTRSRTC